MTTDVDLRRSAHPGLGRYAQVFGGALTVAAVTMLVAVPLTGATREATEQFAPQDWWDTFSIFAAAGLARVLAVVTIVTWLAAEAVFSRTPEDSRWRPTPAKILIVGAGLLGVWVAAAYAHELSPCEYNSPCVAIPWPGPHAPFYYTNPPVDWTLPPELWPPSVLHLDVDVAVGPALILVALAIGLYGARSTASRAQPRAQASPLASRSAAALTGVFAVLCLTAVAALTTAASTPDAFPRYSAITDLGLWGALSAVVTGFLISGRRRIDSALLVAVVLAQEWGAVQLWFSGESYAYLGVAVAAVVATAVATIWRPLAVALDALIGAHPVSGVLDAPDLHGSTHP